MSSRALFWVILVLVCWVLCRRIRTIWARQILLLFFSYGLYATFGLSFLVVLIFSSVLNYLLGRSIQSRQSSLRLWVGILLNIAILGGFKYLPEIQPLFKTADFSLFGKLIQPVGISFWTFQALSYLFDQYRGENLDPSLMEFLLFMAFWPTVLSGPICRLSNLLTQFRRTVRPNFQEIRYGMDRICVGLFMMALGGLIANGIRPNGGLDHAFDGGRVDLGGLDVWCVAVGYGFDLFFNFAGYSHLVIGAARMFGFQLPENFNHPYSSTTVSEFWTRWHMSLSFWIRDYMFLPLVMLKRSKWWRSAALVISMLVFGLWHRGTALLALWGLYHGILLVIHRQWQELTHRFGSKFRATLLTPIYWLLTFGSINLGWVLFRSSTVSQALAMLHTALLLRTYSRFTLPDSFYFLVLLLVVGYLATVVAQKFLGEHFEKVTLPIEARAALYAIAIYIGILHTAQSQAFIYFQF